MSDHTPFPWHTGGTFFKDGMPHSRNIYGPIPDGAQSGELVAEYVSIKNVDAIVRACNAHEALLAACQWASRAYIQLNGDGCSPLLDALNGAIAKATGGDK